MEENTMKYGDVVVDEDTLTGLAFIALIGMGVTGVVVGRACYKGVKKIGAKIQEYKQNKKDIEEEIEE